ncbi:MAG TPA: hypothetical protein PKO15_16615, partial [Fibrobacteria bacterium]|nr:hypothetical protein [Fibrobacteria bacterium]
MSIAPTGMNCRDRKLDLPSLRIQPFALPRPWNCPKTEIEDMHHPYFTFRGAQMPRRLQRVVAHQVAIATFRGAKQEASNQNFPISEIQPKSLLG